MDGCEIVVSGPTRAWYCRTHDCQMDQSQAPPVSCLKVRPISSKERKWLQKEELRLTRHFIVGTMTREDKKRLAEVKELLSAS